MAILFLVPACGERQQGNGAEPTGKVHELLTKLGADQKADEAEIGQQIAALGPTALPELKKHLECPIARVARCAAALIDAWKKYLVLREEIVEGTGKIDDASKAMKEAGSFVYDVLVSAYTTASANNWRVREHIIQLAGEIDSGRAIDFFEEILNAEDEMMKTRVIHFLPRIATDRSVSLLIKVLLEGESNTQLQAQIALGEMGAPAVQGLLELLKGEDAVQRALAATAIGRLNERTPKPSRCVRKQGLLPKIVDALMAAREDRDPQVQAAAVHALARHSRERFRESLSHGSPEVRRTAVQYLRQQRAHGATDDFLNAIHDPDPGVRVEAAMALDRPREMRVIEALTEALDDEASEVRAAAAGSLGSMSHSARYFKDESFTSDLLPVDKLISMARDKSLPEKVQQSVVHGLMGIDDKRVFALAREILRSENPASCAAEALARSGEAEDAELLISLLTEKNVCFSDPLTRMGTIAIPALERGLKKGPDEARLRIVWILRNMRNPETTPVLTGALADKSVKVRLAAAVTLGEAGDAKAIEALAPLLGDPEETVQIAAATSLTMLGDYRAKERAVAYHSRRFRERSWKEMYEMQESGTFLAKYVLKKGMTKEEVTKLMGNPPGKTGRSDYWWYATAPSCGISLTFKDNKLEKIWP